MTDDKKMRSVAIFIEAVRYAELERKELQNGEQGMMIRSVWKLCDPCGVRGNERAVSTMIKSENGDGLIRFTAHSHDNEPLEKSADDELVYRTMHHDGKNSAHYIIDRFCPKKII